MSLWKTRSGEEIPIPDLTDEHLTNIILMFLTAKQPDIANIRLDMLQDAYTAQAQCRGEGAYDAVSSEIHRIENLRPEEVLCEHSTIFKALYEEWRKRQH